VTDRREACSALVVEIAALRIVPAILTVAKRHAHFISQFGELAIRPTVGRLKAAATRSMKSVCFDAPQLWAKAVIWSLSMAKMNSWRRISTCSTMYRRVPRYINGTPTSNGNLIVDWHCKKKRRQAVGLENVCAARPSVG
jgi:hypothetical protein